MNRNFGRPPTVLDEQDTQLPPEDREQLRSEWLDRTLDQLIAFAGTDPTFAKKLCRKVMDFAGDDDRLVAVVRKCLAADRLGKKKGPKKWDYARSAVFLTHYYLLLDGQENRAATLEWLEKSEGLGSTQAVENRLSKAKALVRIEDLPDFVRAIVANRENRTG